MKIKNPILWNAGFLLTIVGSPILGILISVILLIALPLEIHTKAILSVIITIVITAGAILLYPKHPTKTGW